MSLRNVLFQLKADGKLINADTAFLCLRTVFTWSINHNFNKCICQIGIKTKSIWKFWINISSLVILFPYKKKKISQEYHAFKKYKKWLIERTKLTPQIFFLDLISVNIEFRELFFFTDSKLLAI